MATNSCKNSNIKTLSDLDELYKKLNKTSNIDDVRIKRQVNIDKKRYEQGLELENSINEQHQQQQQLNNDLTAREKHIKIETEFDISRVELEQISDRTIKNEINKLLDCSHKTGTENDVEIIEIDDNKHELIVLSDDDDDEDDDDVIILNKSSFTDELRTKLEALDINKIVKVEEIDEKSVNSNELICKKEEIYENTTTTTTIMLDSLLGTISGFNDEFINELAQKLSSNLNLPVEFMTSEEFDKYKENQSVLSNETTSNKTEIKKEIIIENSIDNDDISSTNNNGGIKIKGQALIQYLFGNCEDVYKNAINRRNTSYSELEARFENLKNNKIQAKPAAFYIEKKKLRKLDLQRKFKKLENHLAEIEMNRNEILTHLYIDKTLNNTDENIIVDISVYKNFLYSCALSGRCCVYNLLNQNLINSTFVKDGVHFIQPLYNTSSFHLNVILGGGGPIEHQKTNLLIYDAILRYKKFSIDLKSPIRCVVFRYSRLYCGLNSGEIVSLNRHLNNIDKPIKITDKKISSIGVALSNNAKVLLVGAYDGKIHILETNTRMSTEYEYKNEFLHGHKLAPLSIKFYNQNVYSCSSDCHILVHCLETRKLVVKLEFNTAITCLIIVENSLEIKLLLSSSADGVIRCHSLKDANSLTLCQQFYGYYKNSRIMCMKFENNFIYYGDEKGFIESIELNLNKIHNCKFLKCNQPFATKTYLLQHLIDCHFLNDKNSIKHKCQWDNCNQIIELNDLKFHLLRHL